MNPSKNFHLNIAHAMNALGILTFMIEIVSQCLLIFNQINAAMKHQNPVQNQ